jgi:translation initiation factor IF-2
MLSGDALVMVGLHRFNFADFKRLENAGFILEAYKDNRRGTVASILVQEGTLRVNDILVSGSCYGKVKSMVNDRGKNIKVAEPSTPVEITGLSDVPDAGEPFFVAKDEKIAKEFTTQIKERKRNAELSSRKFDPWAQFKDNKQLNVIIKADVQGSLEALTKSLGALSTEDVELSIVHAAVGGATENDVQLAVASSAIIVGFNTRPDARAAEIAKREGILMETFSVIYDIIDYVKDAMSGLLDPIIGENVMGHTEVRETFNVPKVGTIAGGYVTDGVIKRGAKCRLLRNGKIIYDSKIASLKRFKDDAKEVRTGFECGFSIENYNDIKVGDVVEVYEVTETKQSL